MHAQHAPQPAAREQLGPVVMKLFEHWQLTPADQLALLGLSEENRAALSRYRQGKPLAQSRDLLDRVGILLGIHKNLRLLFPHNRDLAYRWMRQPNRAFDGATPVDMVREHGFSGLLMVRAYLDTVRGQ